MRLLDGERIIEEGGFNQWSTLFSHLNITTFNYETMLRVQMQKVWNPLSSEVSERMSEWRRETSK